MSTGVCATVPKYGITTYPATQPLFEGAQLTVADPFPGAVDNAVGADGTGPHAVVPPPGRTITGEGMKFSNAATHGDVDPLYTEFPEYDACQ